MAGPTNQQFALAVHVLTLLAGGPEALHASPEMALSTGANAVHVRRVLGVLREAGLVASRPGVGGGWRLLVDPATTSLAAVWQALHGDDPILGLHSANPDCPVGRRIQAELVAVDRRAARAIEAELAMTTLSELVVPAAAPA